MKEIEQKIVAPRVAFRDLRLIEYPSRNVEGAFVLSGIFAQDFQFNLFLKPSILLRIEDRHENLIWERGKFHVSTPELLRVISPAIEFSEEVSYVYLENRILGGKIINQEVPCYALETPKEILYIPASLTKYISMSPHSPRKFNSGLEH